MSDEWLKSIETPSHLLCLTCQNAVILQDPNDNCNCSMNAIAIRIKNAPIIKTAKDDYKKYKEEAEFPADKKSEIVKILHNYYSDAGLSPHLLCAPAKNPVEAMKLIEEMYAMTKNRAKKQKLIGYMTESDSDKWKASTKLIFEAHARKDVYSVL